MPNLPTDTTSFDRVRYWKDFRATADHLFPTNDSLKWFLRRHERELREAGAVLKLNRGIFVDPELFRAIALPLMKMPRQEGSAS